MLISYYFRVYALRWRSMHLKNNQALDCLSTYFIQWIWPSINSTNMTLNQTKVIIWGENAQNTYTWNRSLRHIQRYLTLNSPAPGLYESKWFYSNFSNWWLRYLLRNFPPGLSLEPIDSVLCRHIGSQCQSDLNLAQSICFLSIKKHPCWYQIIEPFSELIFWCSSNCEIPMSKSI